MVIEQLSPIPVGNPITTTEKVIMYNTDWFEDVMNTDRLA